MAIDLEELIERLPPRPGGEELLDRFVPPARFSDKTFEDYRPDPEHPSQAEALDRLREFAKEIEAEKCRGWSGRLRGLFGSPADARGIYLDGGFGVGKTHLLAAFWNASPQPKAYLSFDELVYTIGLLGVEQARSAFSDRRVIAIDEWELDDPGNLKLALAFLRGAIADRITVVVTSNTLPIELGAGRFSQKDFRSEIEELADAFSVLRIAGSDFRHRHFEAHPGRGYFRSEESLGEAITAAVADSVAASFEELLAALERIHPIRYSAFIDQIPSLYVSRMKPIERLDHALRWVHFIDKLYDASVPFAASATMTLAELFPRDFLTGPYGKKMSRCLSRMEEMLSEGA